jgi:hypothetical protein
VDMTEPQSIDVPVPVLCLVIVCLIGGSWPLA